MAKKPTFPKRVFKHRLPESMGGESYQIGDAGKRFVLTEAKLKESIENQAAWAETSVSPFTNVSPEMAGVYRARRDLKDWYEAYQRTEVALATAKGREAKAEIKAVRARLATQIAECLATLGLFDEALAMSPKGDKVRRAEYRALRKALNRPDSDTCKCDVTDHPFLVTKHALHGWVFDPRAGQLRPLVRCGMCGFMNVQPLPDALAAQREVRAQAAGIAKGRSHTDAHAALRQVGLTAEKVFGLNQ